MKTQDQIQRAHDVVIPILSGQILKLDPGTELAVRAAADVLCWALEHEHNTAFEDNLGRLEAAAAAAGFFMEKQT